MKLDEVPLDQIERWLDGSAGTVSAFGSLLADEHPDMGSSKAGSSPLAQTLDNEGTPEVVCMKTYHSIANAPRRISPIRGMRSSASRNGSRDNIGAAF
jgi:hypothetical protein